MQKSYQLLIFLLITLGGLTIASMSTAHAAEEWTYVGTHPQATLQPTSLGKQIQILIAWDGKIYAGYGDYQDNKGPIAITPFDPTTNTFGSPFILQSDALYNYRIIGEDLYAPSTDTIANTIDYAVRKPNGTWQAKEIGTTTHIYDMATLTGSDLYMAGSRGGSAVIWRSIDQGATWQDSLVLFKNIPNSVWRFYFTGVYNNKLYVQMKNLNGSADSISKVFDGTKWSDGPSLIPEWAQGWRPIVFANKLLYLSRESTGNLLAFDGTTYALVKSPTGAAAMSVYGMQIYHNELYLLIANNTTTNAVYKTNDLITWAPVSMNAPVTGRSLAILNDMLFVGTTDSKIYRFNLPANTTPTISTKKGDANNDGKIDLIDFNLWRTDFLSQLYNKRSDLNNDTKVDIVDFNIWRNNFLQ